MEFVTEFPCFLGHPVVVGCNYSKWENHYNSINYEINGGIFEIVSLGQFLAFIILRLFSKSIFTSCCSLLYCTVLYCSLLYCTVLYFTVLYCTVLYCTVLYCTVLYCKVLYCSLLYCTVLYSTVLYFTVLYCMYSVHSSSSINVR